MNCFVSDGWSFDGFDPEPEDSPIVVLDKKKEEEKRGGRKEGGLTNFHVSPISDSRCDKIIELLEV